MTISKYDHTIRTIFAKWTESMAVICINGQLDVQAAQLMLITALRELAQTIDAYATKDAASANDTLRSIEQTLMQKHPNLWNQLRTGDTTLDLAIKILIAKLETTIDQVRGEAEQANKDLTELRAEFEAAMQPLAEWLLQNMPGTYNDHNKADITDATLFTLDFHKNQTARWMKYGENRETQLHQIREWLINKAGDDYDPDEDTHYAAGNAIIGVASRLKEERDDLRTQLTAAQPSIDALRIWITTNVPSLEIGKNGNNKLGDLAVKTIYAQKQRIADLEAELRQLQEKTKRPAPANASATPIGATSLIDLIDRLYTEHAYAEASFDKKWPFNPIFNLINTHAKLAPTDQEWRKYPWATAIAIDANGDRYAFKHTPYRNEDSWVIQNTGEQTEFIDTAEDLGVVPWMWCYWERPAAA